MILGRHLRKLISVVTVGIFTWSSCVWSMPVQGIEVTRSSETPAFLKIDIPPALAEVEEIYEAPAKVDPKLIIHVQNAHGSYDAALKIRKLLQYLHEAYNFNLFFVEGAIEELNPDYLRMFPDSEHNVQFADRLAREGKITGAEYFMIDAPPEIRAVGIEHSKLYRENYEMFQSVMNKTDVTQAFLDALEARLHRLASKQFSPELKSVLEEWKKFDEGHREFLPSVQRLAEESKKYMNLDMGQLFSQVEWPQITRLLVLQSMEEDLDLDKGRAERDKVISALGRMNISMDLIDALRELETSHIRMNRLEAQDNRMENLPRFLIERLLKEAGPEGFHFKDYPDFSLYAAYFILKSEMDSTALFYEIEELFRRLMASLTKTKEDRLLLALYRDHRYLSQLFHLELTRDGWHEFLRRPEELSLDAVIERLARREPGEEPLALSEDLQGVFKDAQTFYRLATQRETVFYYMIQRGMHTDAEDKSALITGGFHTYGVFDRFREDEVNYGILMPKLRGEISKETYVRTMLGEHPSMFRTATLEQRIVAQSRAALELTGGVERDVVLQQIGDAVTFNADDLLKRGEEYTADQMVGLFTPGNPEQVPFSKLRRSDLRFDRTGNNVYIRYDGEYVRDEEGRYQVLQVGEREDGYGKTVRILLPAISTTTEAPDADLQGLPILPERPEPTLSEIDLAQIPDAPRPLPPSPDERFSRLSDLAESIRMNLDAPQVTAEQGTSNFFEILSNLDLAAGLGGEGPGSPDDFVNAVMTLVTRVLPLNLNADDTVNLLNVLAQMQAANVPDFSRIVTTVQSRGTELASDLPGILVPVTNSRFSEAEIVNLKTMLGFNPNQQVHFVVLAEDGEDLSALREELGVIKSNVVKSLSALGVPSVNDRLSFRVTRANQGSVRTAVREIYNKQIRGSRRTDAFEKDFRTIGNAFVILGENDTNQFINYRSFVDQLPVTIVESEVLPEDLKPLERFPAAWLSQHLSTDKTQAYDAMKALTPKQASKLKEGVYRGMMDREWKIVKEGLGFLDQAIRNLVQILESQETISSAA